LGIRLKLNPLRDVIAGKRLVVVDDSIVRGNTQRALVRMLREAGAAEVHVRISSPPVSWPCFYGIDFATRAELIAPGMRIADICQSIGADSLGYISLEGLVASTGVPMSRLCRACFDGVYPIRVPDQAAAEMGLTQPEDPVPSCHPERDPSCHPERSEGSLPSPNPDDDLFSLTLVAAP
jgi:amidophosphoribosyltransferase